MGRSSEKKATGGAKPKGTRAVARSRFWNPEATEQSGIRRAARLTFAGIPDDPESHYHEAPGLTAEATTAAILDRVEHVASAAALDALEGKALQPVDVSEIHRVIFEPIFGKGTLRQRSRRHDGSSYGITKGTREKPHDTTQNGTAGPRVSEKMREAFERFELEREAVLTTAETQEIVLADAVRPAAKLYARLIGIHPFVDGNGRTGFCVLTHALIRCGVLAVALPEDDERAFHWCLGQAMRKDRVPDYEPLTELIVGQIVASGE